MSHIAQSDGPRKRVAGAGGDAAPTAETDVAVAVAERAQDITAMADQLFQKSPSLVVLIAVFVGLILGLVLASLRR